MQSTNPARSPNAEKDGNEWKKTAGILCSVNCGIEVLVGGKSGREFEKIRGDKDHPISQGYLCEKAQCLGF